MGRAASRWNKCSQISNNEESTRLLSKDRRKDPKNRKEGRMAEGEELNLQWGRPRYVCRFPCLASISQRLWQTGAGTQSLQWRPSINCTCFRCSLQLHDLSIERGPHPETPNHAEAVMASVNGDCASWLFWRLLHLLLDYFKCCPWDILGVAKDQFILSVKYQRSLTNRTQHLWIPMRSGRTFRRAPIIQIITSQDSLHIHTTTIPYALFDALRWGWKLADY